MTKEELQEILDKHLKWLNNEKGGERANLRSANLEYANLRNADLRNANLYDANLYDADLYGANLRNADLCGADLRNADLWNVDLWNADLRNANLRDASLYGANLYDANLYDADLYGANLCDASLRNADLRNADLRNANLRNADLRNANLRNANLRNADLWNVDLWNADLRNIKNADKLQDLLISYTSICPEGTIIGWKKCRNNVVVKLEIPAEAKRSNATGRKCRAEYVRVLEVIGAKIAISSYNLAVVYRAGEIVCPDKWDENRWDECSNGIHFFITRTEAENY